MRQPTQEYTTFTLEKWLRKIKHFSKNTSSNITTMTTVSNVVIRNWIVSRRWGQHRSWPHLACFVKGLPHGSCLEYTQESLHTPGVWPSKHRQLVLQNDYMALIDLYCLLSVMFSSNPWIDVRRTDCTWTFSYIEIFSFGSDWKIWSRIRKDQTTEKEECCLVMQAQSIECLLNYGH